MAGTQHGLVHIKLVRVDRALHHRLAQAVAGSDEHHVLKAAFGVDGEHHTRRAQVAAHHALHTGGQSHISMGKALVHAVADGAVVVEGRKNFLHLVQHVFNADHIQKGFLLAGERGVGQVFGGGRGAHRKARLRVAGAQLRKTLADGSFKISGERLGFNQGANLRAGRGQRTHVLGVQLVEHTVDFFIKTGMRQKHPESVCRRRKAGGHAHPLGAGGQLGNHLAEAGVLAADRLDVCHPQVFKRHDQGGRLKQLRHRNTPGGFKTGQFTMSGSQPCCCLKGLLRCMASETG